MKKIHTLVLPLALLLFGCAHDSHTRKATMMVPYLSGDLATARLEAVHMRNHGKSVDRVIDALEQGYLDFLLGDYQSARDAFVYAEQQTWDMEDRAMLSATNLSKDVLSNLTNPTKIEYRAKCGDQIMLHILKALSYLGMGMHEAYDTEIFPLHQTMQDIEQKYMALFQKESNSLQQTMNNNQKNADRANKIIQTTPNIDKLAPNTAVRNFLNPLALLMAGVARAEAHDWENAKIDFKKLYAAMPNSIIAGQFEREVRKRENSEIPPYLASLPELEFNPNGGNVLVVFANGRGAALTQYKIDSAVLHAAIPVPQVYTQNTVPTLHIVGDNRHHNSELLSDMDSIALWQYRLGYNEMITRTVVSTIVKEGASFAATAVAYNVVKNNSNYGYLAELAAVTVFLLADIYKQSQNIADTRSWETLPAQFQAAILQIPKDRRILLSVDNQTWAEATIPQNAKSAIIYVHCLNNGQLRHTVFVK